MEDPKSMGEKWLTQGVGVLRREAAAVQRTAAGLGGEFVAAVSLLLHCQGRVVVTGIGKSGQVGRKIAATLASTGTPAFFVHASESIHGDLGMITGEDLVVAISHSGETSELLAMLPSLQTMGVKVIALTGESGTTLGRAGVVNLLTHAGEEADHLGLAPTSSSLAALALGDALAVTVAAARGFDREQFALYHPGGSLGKKLAENREE
jgi:arabinose-5-phosphate isomerase